MDMRPETDDPIILSQQKVCQKDAILARDARDECFAFGIHYQSSPRIGFSSAFQHCRHIMEHSERARKRASDSDLLANRHKYISRQSRLATIMQQFPFAYPLCLHV